MGHHHHHPHGEGAGDRTRRALAWALGLNGAFLVIEAAVGFATGSLALLSDAAHMVSDVGALALALGAATLARAAASPSRSYGWWRAETLGAFVNGLLLVGVCLWIFWEAGQRLLLGAPEVTAWPVAVVGAIGLAINLGSAAYLYSADQHNLNVRGALIHMLADALGSVGAVVSAVFLAFGVGAADAVISLLIGGLVLWGTWGLLRDSTRILLQFSPTSAEEVRDALVGLDGLEEVHDLHLWSLDGQRAVLSAHLVASGAVTTAELRVQAESLLRERFSIHHTTLQMETSERCAHEACPFWGDTPAPEHDHHDHDHHDHRDHVH